MYERIIRAPNVVMVEESRACLITQDSSRFEYGDVVVETAAERQGLAVYITATESPVKQIRLRWHFREKLKGMVLGDTWERAYADLGWTNITPYKAYPWYVLLNRESSSVGYGVMVRPGAICSWQADPEGITLRLDVRNGGNGVMLQGRRLFAACVVSETYEEMSAFHAAQLFCRRMCSDPVFPDHPVYGSNNWYYAYGHSSAEEIVGDARYLAKLTAQAEAKPYMVIDDGWQRGRYDEQGSYEEIYNGGPWLPNERFGDMEKLARRIGEQGVIPGIWVRLLQDSSVQIPEEWRLPHTQGLDPSHPQVLEHVGEIISRIGRWGYRLLKHDFSTYDITGCWGCEMVHEITKDGWSFFDKTRTTAEIIVDFYRAVYEAAKAQNMLVLGCNTMGHLGAGLIHINRTGEDTSGMMWEKTLRFGVNTLAFRMAQHGAFYDVDADCMGIMETMPWTYNRQWGELLSLSGTPMFVSVKPDTLGEDEERELSRFLCDNAQRRAPAQPLDWQETALPQKWLLDGKERDFSWYEPWGLRVPCANGPVWEKVWADVCAARTRDEHEP